MIKVSVMYPNGPDARFDEAYYRDRHMPMVKELMGDHCKSYAVDGAIPGGVPAANAAFHSAQEVFAQMDAQVASQ